MAAGNGQHNRPSQSLSESLQSAFRQAMARVSDRLNIFAAQSPPAVAGLGARLTQPFAPRRDPAQEARLRSVEAFGGSATYRAGMIPAWLSTYQGGLTAQRIKAIKNEVMVTGIMFNLASLYEEIFSLDLHVQSVDESMRDAVTGKPFCVEACDGSDLALQVADYLNATVDNIAGYRESCKRLLFGNAGGYAIEEAIFDEVPTVLRCKAGAQTIEVEAHHPRSRRWVSNKCTRWDVDREQLELDLGNGSTARLPEHKYIVYEAPGDFQVRRRGYLWGVAPYHLIKQNAIVRWAVVLEIWGIPVPIAKVDYSLWQDLRRRQEYEGIVRDLGLGKGAVVTDDMDLVNSPTPTVGDARGMHAALIGWVNNEYSKRIQGSTLTTEVGGNGGGYKLGETHADTKESKVEMYERMLSETERRWYRQVLWMACHRFNPDGTVAGINPKGLSARLGVTPEEVIAKCGVPYWRIQREQTPAARMSLLKDAVNELKLDVDPDQPYREFGLMRARDPKKRIPGRSEVLGDKERLVTTSGQTTVQADPVPDQENGAD